MTIDVIREKWAKWIYSGYSACLDLKPNWRYARVIVKDRYRSLADEFLNTEIVPERECPSCGGIGYANYITIRNKLMDIQPHSSSRGFKRNEITLYREVKDWMILPREYGMNVISKYRLKTFLCPNLYNF